MHILPIWAEVFGPLARASHCPSWNCVWPSPSCLLADTLEKWKQLLLLVCLSVGCWLLSVVRCLCPGTVCQLKLLPRRLFGPSCNATCILRVVLASCVRGASSSRRLFAISSSLAKLYHKFPRLPRSSVCFYYFCWIVVVAAVALADCFCSACRDKMHLNKLFLDQCRVTLLAGYFPAFMSDCPSVLLLFSFYFLHYKFNYKLITLEPKCCTGWPNRLWFHGTLSLTLWLYQCAQLFAYLCWHFLFFFFINLANFDWIAANAIKLIYQLLKPGCKRLHQQSSPSRLT